MPEYAEQDFRQDYWSKSVNLKWRAMIEVLRVYKHAIKSPYRFLIDESEPFDKKLDVLRATTEIAESFGQNPISYMVDFRGNAKVPLLYELNVGKEVVMRLRSFHKELEDVVKRARENGVDTKKEAEDLELHGTALNIVDSLVDLGKDLFSIFERRPQGNAN